MSAPAGGLGPVLPTPDNDTAGYWAGAREGELRIQQCRTCATFQHFPAAICSTCLSFDLDFSPVSGLGEVYSFVVIHRTNSPYFEARSPYTMAWVELPEQRDLRVLAEIVECRPDDVTIGMPVSAVFDVLDSTVSLLQFRPA